MKRTATILIATALSLMTAAQNRFEAAAHRADSIFSQTKEYKDMLYNIEQELNYLAVHLSPLKQATATADYLLDNGLRVTQVIIYMATNSVIIYVPPKKGKKYRHHFQTDRH